MIDSDNWEVTAIDTVFRPDGSQLRTLDFVHQVPDRNILLVMDILVAEHVRAERERQSQGRVEAAEHD